MAEEVDATISRPSLVPLAFSAHYCGFEANTFRRRRASSAASASNQSRKVATFALVEVA
jgi:hypothetical protein